MNFRSLNRFKRLIAPQSLRLQLLSRTLVIMSGLLVLIGLFQYFIMSHFLYQSTAANIRSQIRNAPPHAWDQLLNRGQGIGPNRNPFFSLNISSIAFIAPNGQFSDLQGVAPKLALQQYQTAGESLHMNGSYQIVRDSQGNSQLIVLAPVATLNGGPIGTLQIGTYVSSLQHVLLQQLFIFVFLSLLALILGLFTFLPILRRTLVPLSRMVATVRRINAGNLDERLETKNAQLELQLLSTSFNDMLERLHLSFAAEREAKEKMRRFVADASHELRTPLTSIHGFLEVLLRGAWDKPEQLHKALRSMYGESERLTKLVQDLLVLAQLDRERQLTLTAGSLDALLRDMEPQLRLLAGARRVFFSLTPVRAMYDRDGIKQVILNLFQNAVQHTDPATGEIHVSLIPEQQALRLEVQDNGPGIPQDQASRVFERFYRLDSARSRAHGGSGLGLAITKSIVESHHGNITCVGGLGQGARFRVTLPRLEQDESHQPT